MGVNLIFLGSIEKRNEISVGAKEFEGEREMPFLCLYVSAVVWSRLLHKSGISHLLYSYLSIFFLFRVVVFSVFFNTKFRVMGVNRNF